MESNLKLLNEAQLKTRLKDIDKHEGRCDHCSKVTNSTFYPYAFDVKYSNVIHVGLCEHCGNVLYMHD